MVYELYFKDGGNYIDVPVAIKNMQKGKLADDYRTANSLTFVRRFFIVDYLSHVKSNTTDFLQAYTDVAYGECEALN